MKPKRKVSILVILTVALVLGLITTLITDNFEKSNTTPANYVYSSDNVLYLHSPLIPVTQSESRGFPFISQAKVIKKYEYEYANKNLGPSAYKNEVISKLGSSSITVQLPAVSSSGSNSFSTIFATWQFYADVLIWTIVWSLLGYLIASISHKKKLGRYDRF